MKLVKPLNIKGAVLSKQELENYLMQIASDHILQNSSNPDTYPIVLLDNNFEFITKTYSILKEHLRLNISIHPAGEWLLDNYYIIEEAYKEIKKNMNLKKYKSFIGIANGQYKGYSRIYVLASEIVAYTDGKIVEDDLSDILIAYQNKKTLNMEEIWNIGLFFKIALIEKIREVCEKIYSSQIQKYKAESLIERFLENKENNKRQYILNNNIKNYTNQSEYPFIEYLSYRLKKYGKKSIAYANVLEEQVNLLGMSISEVINKEHFDIALKKVSIGNCITSIKTLQRLNISEIFEKINGVEEVLKKDPAKIYSKMDYKTKEYYRQKIKEFSKKTKISEIYIVRKIIDLANKNISNPKKAHVGYYLIDEGIYELGEELKTDKLIKKDNEKKVQKYILFLALLSIFTSIIISKSIYQKANSILIEIISLFLIFIPITEIYTKIIQYVLSKIIKPKLIPKMDFSNGIPEDSACMVIIPTIISNEEKVINLCEKLEVFYLANKSENIYFTLLGDCTTSDKKEEEQDTKICEIAKKEITKLNAKYNVNGMPIFNYIYRTRTYNSSEKKYLGWERKRGLITQFNQYIKQIINEKKDKFEVLYGEDFIVNTIEEWKNANSKELLPKKIKYIITLDADTDLVLNSGIELVGAMAHILNTPILNKENTKVIRWAWYNATKSRSIIRSFE